MNPVKYLTAFISNRVAVVTTTMVGLSLWIYSRVAQINPALLQDEWLYMVSSRVDSPWSQTPAYDAGNYLFNLIYTSTNLCGEAFYSCAKILNLFFLAGFALLLFMVALRFMPFWAAFTVLVAVYASPISIYASMYLPESLYYALLALAFYFATKLIASGNSKTWMLVGAALGAAALSKPHGLFTVAAFGLFLIVFELSRKAGFSGLLKSIGYYAGAFLVVRLGLGLAVAGPKSLNVLGVYGASDSVGEFVTGVGSAGGVDAGSLVGAGPVAGALGLFAPQMSTHTLVLSALIGGLFALLILAAIEAFRRKATTEATSVAVLMLIWIGVFLIVVALFTGWITGSGDDHTTRVLLRYYEFLIPMSAVPALGYLFAKGQYSGAKAWSRIAASAVVFVAITLSFSGLFSTLQIQIADAPSVAGLISSPDVWNFVGVASAIGVVALAFFPKPAPYIMLATFSISMLGLGFQTQNQYLAARGDASESDIAGQFVRNYVPAEEVASVEILTNSRFEGRVASFWMESDSPLQIIERGGVVNARDLEPGRKWVLALGLTALENYSGKVISGAGFTLYELKDSSFSSLSGQTENSNLESIEGFGPEMGGLRWTVGNAASIKFKQNLPANAVVRMEISALPGIFEQDVQVTLGDSTVLLKIQEVFALNQLELQFANSLPANEIQILIPEVKSNAEAGFGTSTLKLGLGISKIELVK